MGTNPEGKQDSARTIATSSGVFTEDLMAMCEAEGYTGTVNERLLAWANNRNSASDTNVTVALNRYAVSQGFATWAELNSIDAP